MSREACSPGRESSLSSFHKCCRPTLQVGLHHFPCSRCQAASGWYLGLQGRLSPGCPLKWLCHHHTVSQRLQLQHLHIPIALRVSLGGPGELHLPDQGSKYSTCKVQQFGVIFQECQLFHGKRDISNSSSQLSVPSSFTFGSAA